ncbi:MAG TPA: hypothetical protein VM487_05290 [Phycisphaerae bacterium]|nr:hypothetical protein [Phycisphaerae bacterium]
MSVNDLRCLYCGKKRIFYDAHLGCLECADCGARGPIEKDRFVAIAAHQRIDVQIEDEGEAAKEQP